MTQEAIVDAALAVLDADGLDLLSMRHVGRTLNTTAAALYWHVGSKDGLLDLIFDRVIGEQEVPDPDPERWQEQLKEVARSMRATILGHRDIVRLSIGRLPLGPNALRYADRVLAILRAGAFRPRWPSPATTCCSRSSSASASTRPARAAGHRRPPPGEDMARAYLVSLPAERFPHLVELAEHIAAPDADERFELLLDVYVDGLAQRASASTKRSSSSRSL